MGAHIDFEDLQITKKWSPFRAITQPKLSLFCFTRTLSAKLANKKIDVNIIDPGLVMTPYQTNAPWYLKALIYFVGKPVDYVADSFLHLGTKAETKGITGKCYKYLGEIAIKGEALDEAVCKKLWEASASCLKIDSNWI